MVRFLPNLLLLLVLLGGCGTEPEIYLPSDPVPVVYAIFDDHDTIHYIHVGKTFGAEHSPSDFGFNYDSLYWDKVEIEVRLKEEYTNEWIVMQAHRIEDASKEPGFFHYPKNQYFQFERVILDTPSHPMRPKTYSIDTIALNIFIEGLENIEVQIKRIDSVEIRSPFFNQQYVYLVPDSPLLFLWSSHGHAWSEIDVSFEFIEELESGFRSNWVHIQNTQYFESAFELYRQLNITYDEFIREVLLQIKEDPEVIRRYLGYISMHIAGGDDPMVQYRKYMYGISDYNPAEYSNVPGAYGFIGTSTHFNKDSMRFDYDTRQTLINENRLKKLKISPWTE